MQKGNRTRPMIQGRDQTIEPSAVLTRASPFHYGATFTPHITFAY